MSRREYKHLIIIGSRRGGTTCFWKTFRQDKRFLCYDEPFRSELIWYARKGIDDDDKCLSEYLDIRDLIEDKWVAIQLYEEASAEFTGCQERYLRALFDTAEHVCVDFVRCHCKIGRLREMFPDALIINLVRDPRGYATSHLKPHGKWTTPGMEKNIFRYVGLIDHWRMSEMSSIMGIKGYGHEKLMQIWRYFTNEAVKQNPDLSIRYEDFALDPEGMTQEVYKAMGMAYEPMDYSGIHKPKTPHLHKSDEWRKAARRMQIDRRCFHPYFERVAL